MGRYHVYTHKDGETFFYTHDRNVSRIGRLPLYDGGEAVVGDRYQVLKELRDSPYIHFELYLAQKCTQPVPWDCTEQTRWPNT